MTPTEPIRETYKSAAVVAPTGGDLDVVVDKLLLGDDVVAKGVDDESLLGVALEIVNRGSSPYELKVSRVSLWLDLDPRRPDSALSFSPIAGGTGAAPDELIVSPSLPTIVVPPGQSVKAWVFFLGYQFPDSDIPRQVTLNLPGPDGQTIRVALADPARGSLRWKVPARRSQTMVGFHNAQLFSGPFRGLVPATAFSRVGRMGTWLWDVGLVSGVAIQQEGTLASSTSAFSTLGLSAHLTAPLTTWGPWRNPRRLGLYAGAGAAWWIELATPAAMKAQTPPSVYGTVSVDGGLELAIGSTTAAATPFPLAPDPRVGLPRWFLRIGYTQTWLNGGTSGGLVSGFRVAF